MSENTVTLAGTLPGAAGASYLLKPSGWLADSTNLLTIPPVPVRGQLAASGGAGLLSVPGLLATDSSGPYPSGWTWSCSFSGIAGVPELDFSFFLPAGPFSFTATDASPAVFTAPGSSGDTQLCNGMGVVLAGGSLPGGFTPGTYYLVNVASTTFGLAAAPGGSPIASTSAGSGTLTVTSADISGLAQVRPSEPMAAYLQGSYPGGTADFLRADGQWGAPPGGGGAVDSVNGQTGVVELTAGDVDADASGAAATAQSNAETFATVAVATETARAEAAEALLAPLASAALTGSPTAPTADALTDSTQLATTAYADSAVAVETNRAEQAEALKAPLGVTVRTVSVNTTLASSDGLLLINAASGDLAVALPNPATVTGQPFYLKRTDTSGNYVTVTPYASELIDGGLNGYLANTLASMILVSDGTNWWTL